MRAMLILRRWYIITSALAFLTGCAAKPVAVQAPPDISGMPTPLPSTVQNIIFENRSERVISSVTVTNWGEQKAEVELRAGLGIKRDVYLDPKGGRTSPWDIAPGNNVFFACRVPPCAFRLDFPGALVMSGRATERVTNIIFVNQSDNTLDPLIIAVTDEALQYSASGDTLPSHSVIVIKDPNRNTRLNLEARDQLPFVFAVTLGTEETVELSCFGDHTTGTCRFNAYLTDATAEKEGQIQGNVYETIYSGVTRLQSICIVVSANPKGTARSYARVTVKDSLGNSIIVFDVDDKATMAECVTLQPKMSVSLACGIEDTSTCSYRIYSIP